MKAAARPNAFSAILMFAWRSWTKTKKNPFMVLIDIAVFPLIFLLIFTYLFGGAISGSTGSYLQFLLPGMMVYTITTMTVYTGIAINTDIARGVFNRFRTLPFWQPASIIGLMLIDVLRYAAAVTVITCIGMALGFRPEGGIAGTILAIVAVVLFAFSASWIFAFLGVVVKKTESLTTTSYLVLYPLMFTSNVFVDTSTMPDWLQAAVGINPLSLAASATRGIIHGNAVLADLAWMLGGCAVMIALFAPLTIVSYRRKGQS